MITKLEILRKTKGLTQKELAEKIGFHSSQISQYERGFNARPSENFMTKVSKALGVTKDKLFKNERTK